MNSFESLKERLYQLQAISAGISIMDWDQQCLMSPGSSEARSHHVSILMKMYHEMSTSDEHIRVLEAAEGEVTPGSEEAALTRLVRRQVEKSTKLPSELVAREAMLAASGHEVWVKARKENNFKHFQPVLSEMFEIQKEKAQRFGYEGHAYNALLDNYEEGATTDDCDRMFNSIREPLVQLVKEIQSKPVVDDSCLIGDWDTDLQIKLTKEIARGVGYNLEKGRIDAAPHPFCTGWSNSDVRITTRYLPNLCSALYSTLHECGHAMYEQGTDPKWDRTPLATGVSLGVHESQSRLWENLVGRSASFVYWLRPHLLQYFPQLGQISENDLYAAINKVEASFIRVEADEVTYNLHIMVRYELEKMMLDGRLNVADLPEAWNSKYEEYLGITPQKDAEGCLQDVHWSAGLIGYFPTYSMGNLLSGQIWKVMEEELGDLSDNIRVGNFSIILDWLTEKIYRHGSRYTPKELVHRVTGTELDGTAYMQIIQSKYRQLYGLNLAAAGS